MRNVILCLLLTPLFVLTGCATILHGSTQAFTVASHPSGATISVYSSIGKDASEQLLLLYKTPTSFAFLSHTRGTLN